MLGRKREKSGFFARFLGFVYGTWAQIGRLTASISARSIDAGPHQPATVARIPRGLLPRAHPRRVFAGRRDGQTDQDQHGVFFDAFFCALHYLTQKRRK